MENNSGFLGGFDGRIWNIIWKPHVFKNLLWSHFKIDFHNIYTIKDSILYTFTVYLEIIFWVIEFKYIKFNILCLMVKILWKSIFKWLHKLFLINVILFEIYWENFRAWNTYGTILYFLMFKHGTFFCFEMCPLLHDVHKL